MKSLGVSATEQVHTFETDLGRDLAVKVLILPRKEWRRRPEARDPSWSRLATADRNHVVAVRADLLAPGLLRLADPDRLGQEQHPAAGLGDANLVNQG